MLLPRAGGNYVFLREGYGRWAGFLWGWVEFWIIRSASIAALATMFTESFHDVLKQAIYPNGIEYVLDGSITKVPGSETRSPFVLAATDSDRSGYRWS